jgi:hypothetical protein
LSFTPKNHGLLHHAGQQMRRFQGIGETLEDDVEWFHHISAKYKACVSQVKNKGQEAIYTQKWKPSRTAIW